MTIEELTSKQAEWLNEENGSLNEIDGIDCVACKNKGYVVYACGSALCRKECQCMNKRKAVFRASKSQCGHLLKIFNFDNYKAEEEWQKRVKDLAQEFSEKDNGAFVIGGCVGSGKTHICTAIVNELLKRKEVRYYVWKDLATKLNQLVSDEPCEYEKLLEEVSAVDVLYLDDFFKIAPTEAEKDKAFKIINARYNAALANVGALTIVSSEKSLEKIIRVDEAIGSRLKQMAGKFALTVSGDKNWRLSH